MFCCLFISSFLLNISKAHAQKKYVVVLDAGHGGKDPGNLGNGYREKKIVLNVVLAVGRKLSKQSDIKVIYTRKTDKFIELHNRAKIANTNKADLFVSVHCDAFTRAKAHGAGTFVLGLRGNKGNLEIAKRENAVILLEDDYKSNYDYDPNSPESVIGLSVLQEENLDESLAFASLVQTNFVNAKRYDRSVKQDNFLVLRETIMPSVLIELGFLTNKAEGKFLNSKAGQTKMASAIAKAIINYINQLKLNTIQKQVVANTPKKTVEKTPKEKIAAKKEVVVAKKVVTQPKKEIVKKAVVVKKDNIPVKKTTPIPSGIIYKVQIAASKAYIEPKPYNFKGLQNVEMKSFSDYYRYYYGSSDNLYLVKEHLKDAKEAGMKGAFVVAFENGVKIPLREAIKKQR